MDETRKKWYRFLWNKYLLVGLGFMIWMIFFDENNYFVHQETDNQIEELATVKKEYNQLLGKEIKELEELKSNPKTAEKIAREKYYMKKKNEEVFVIEFAKKNTTE